MNNTNIHALHPSQSESFIALAKHVIHTEMDAIQAMLSKLDQQFERACELILASKGRVIVTGMGKSGHISNKIAATMASTGTPAYFVHPGEALHGDLGMITRDDVVIAISNSGSTEELLVLATATKRQGTKVISMTGNPNSELGEIADAHLDIGVEKEACPLGLAPTSSTTVTLVLGDALAIALLNARGFTHADFARSHPAGRLGKRLLVHVQDIMHKEDSLPVVSPDTSLEKAILEITSKKLGTTLIADKHNTLIGIFTDGDLRRCFEHKVDMSQKIGEITKDCHYTTHGHALAVDALNLMQDKEITALPVINEARKIEGLIHMHDLLKAGIV